MWDTTVNHYINLGGVTDFMKTYRAAVIGCSRMGAFIDNEVVNYRGINLPYSHAAGFYAEERTNLIACADLRPSVMEEFGRQYDVPKQRQYTDYREMIERENLDVIGVATQPEQRAEVVIFAAEHGVKEFTPKKQWRRQWMKQKRWLQRWNATRSPSTWERKIAGTPALTR